MNVLVTIFDENTVTIKVSSDGQEKPSICILSIAMLEAVFCQMTLI